MKLSVYISYTKRNIFFQKQRTGKLEQVLPRGWYQQERGRYKESV
jgi:hypothetical protein